MRVRVTSNLLSRKPLPPPAPSSPIPLRSSLFTRVVLVHTLSPNESLTKITHLKNVHVSLRPRAAHSAVPPAAGLECNLLECVSRARCRILGTEFTLLSDYKYFMFTLKKRFFFLFFSQMSPFVGCPGIL